jgi:ubiquinone/menaquinone biosynthesis C-methylase UbiE
MDAAALSFQAESFDRVLFVGVLHHMPDGLVRQSLAEVERVLRREGRVLIAEPVIVPEWPLSHLFLRMDRGRHIRTLRGYEALFDRFVIERHRMFQFSLHRFASYVLTKRSV